MSYVIIQHSVEDYSRWKPVFDEHASARKAAGCVGGTLYRDAADPNSIVIVFEWSDLTKGRAFAESDTMREAMKRAGVSGAPSVRFLEKLQDLSS